MTLWCGVNASSACGLCRNIRHCSHLFRLMHALHDETISSCIPSEHVSYNNGACTGTILSNSSKLLLLLLLGDKTCVDLSNRSDSCAAAAGTQHAWNTIQQLNCSSFEDPACHCPCTSLPMQPSYASHPLVGSTAAMYAHEVHMCAQLGSYGSCSCTQHDTRTPCRFQDVKAMIEHGTLGNHGVDSSADVSSAKHAHSTLLATHDSTRRAPAGRCLPSHQ